MSQHQKCMETSNEINLASTSSTYLIRNILLNNIEAEIKLKRSALPIVDFKYIQTEATKSSIAERDTGRQKPYIIFDAFLST